MTFSTTSTPQATIPNDPLPESQQTTNLYANTSNDRTKNIICAEDEHILMVLRDSKHFSRTELTLTQQAQILQAGLGKYGIHLSINGLKKRLIDNPEETELHRYYITDQRRAQHPPVLNQTVVQQLLEYTKKSDAASDPVQAPQTTLDIQSETGKKTDAESIFMTINKSIWALEDTLHNTYDVSRQKLAIIKHLISKPGMQRIAQQSAITLFMIMEAISSRSAVKKTVTIPNMGDTLEHILQYNPDIAMSVYTLRQHKTLVSSLMKQLFIQYRFSKSRSQDQAKTES